MRIIFAGTPDFAAHILEALLTTDHEICAVYTQPDRPAGRGRKLTPSPVKQLALQNNLAIEQPVNFKQEQDRQKLALYNADLMIVVAYGLILPQVILDTPKLGCININASLLPRWRGAAPIQRAILTGDKETGICIMQMEAGLDTGPVLSRATCQIEQSDTASSLHDRLADLGAKTLLTCLPNLRDLQANSQLQDDSQSNYAEKIQKAEAIINWQNSCTELDQQIRAFNPWPVAQTVWNDKVFRIWAAEPIAEHHHAQAGEILAINKAGITVATGSGKLQLTEVQVPGKKAMTASNFLNANEMKVGEKLG